MNRRTSLGPFFPIQWEKTQIFKPATSVAGILFFGLARYVAAYSRRRRDKG